MAAPYVRLIKLVEHELELLSENRLEELQAAVAKTGEHMASLSTPVPPELAPLLHRAIAMRGRVEAEAARALQGLEHSRTSLRQARKIAATYAPRTAAGYSTSA